MRFDTDSVGFCVVMATCVLCIEFWFPDRKKSEFWKKKVMNNCYYKITG